MNHKYQTGLVCGHLFLSRDIPPPMGSEVYCRDCRNYSMVGYNKTDWRISCVDCKYGRYSGADKTYAHVRASRHVTQYPDHRVKVFRACEPDNWELIRSNQEILPENNTTLLDLLKNWTDVAPQDSDAPF